MLNKPQVTAVGNCVRDPELRWTPSQVALCTFGIAVNTRKKQGDEWVDGEPQFFDVVCWRDLAENVVESITKGTRVVVVGELEQRSWETDSGEKRSKVEINAEEVSPSLRWATAAVTRTGKKDAAAPRPTPVTTEDSYIHRDEAPFVRDAGEWLPGAWGGYPGDAQTTF